jgi:hypothetical protein
MKSQDDMSGMFDDLSDLTLQQRATIKERYRFLLREYRYRCHLYSTLFYVLRTTMTVGSLVVPALLSLKSGPDNDERLYWFTWAVSLAVTTANGLTTLFKLDKRFFMLHAVAEKLRSETWQYLSLAGRYSGYYGGFKPTHRNQYVYYCSQLEKIRMKHIDEEYIRQAELNDKKKDVHTSVKQEEDADDDKTTTALDNKHKPIRPIPSRYIMRGDNQVPSPADPSGLMSVLPTSRNLTHRNRKDSSSTVGSDGTIALVIEESKDEKDEKDEKNEKNEKNEKYREPLSLPGQPDGAPVSSTSSGRNSVLSTPSKL